MERSLSIAAVGERSRVIKRPYGRVLTGVIHFDFIVDTKHFRSAEVCTLHDDAFGQNHARMLPRQSPDS
jgi:hypothetical protein